MSVRLSVNLPDDAAAVLKDLAERHEITVTEAVRRAVATYRYFDDATRNGDKVQTLSGDGKTTTSVVLV